MFNTCTRKVARKEDVCVVLITELITYIFNQILYSMYRSYMGTTQPFISRLALWSNSSKDLYKFHLSDEIDNTYRAPYDIVPL